MIGPLQCSLAGSSLKLSLTVLQEDPMPFFLLLFLLFPLYASAEYLGDLSTNPFPLDSTANPFGAGSPFKSDGINNP